MSHRAVESTSPNVSSPSSSRVPISESSLPASDSTRHRAEPRAPTPPEADRWALVTGGSRGIGRAVALDLADRGWNVALAHLQNDAAAAHVADAIAGLGRRCLVHRANLANREACALLVERLGREVGRLSGLVHCAGLGAPSPALGTRPARWQITWDTHIGALLELVALARPLFTPGASIVAVSSLGTVRVMPGYAPIGAVKGALEVLVRYLAAELAPNAVNVNAVCGGPVDTDSLRSFPFFEALARASGERPPGRLGRPSDLAPIVAFLLGADAAWIRGQVLVADGGFSLT